MLKDRDGDGATGYMRRINFHSVILSLGHKVSKPQSFNKFIITVNWLLDQIFTPIPVQINGNVLETRPLPPPLQQRSPVLATKVDAPT